MGKRLEGLGGTALLAGGVCYFFAGAVIVGAPWLLTDGSLPVAVGDDGKEYPVAPYTATEQAGRDVYGNQVCWHCHSQFVRPVNDEDKRWGPVSRAGESAHDVPHFFGTRRVGPDLAREGGFRVDDWQFAHLWDPRATVSRSVMPGFTWLFDENPHGKRVREILDVLDTNGDGIVSRVAGVGDDLTNPTPDVEALRAEAAQLDTWGVLSDIRPGTPKEAPPEDPTYTSWRGYPAGDGLLTDFDGRPFPGQRATDLVAYLQRLGTSIPWRKPIFVTAPPRDSPFVDAEGNDLSPPRRSPEMRAHGFLRRDPAKVRAAAEAAAKWKADFDAWAKKNPGLDRRLQRAKELFDVNCASCHGPEGRGNGPAAQHLLIRPRDFTTGLYRYRSTIVGNMPLDGDLYRSIFRGLPGTAMPAWRELPEEHIWLLVDYVKSLNEMKAGGKAPSPFNDRSAAHPETPHRFDKDPVKDVMRGRLVYLAAQCANCHGRQGAADTDVRIQSDWRGSQTPMGNLVRARDFRPRDARDVPALRFRGGAAAEDIYRTIMTGLDGTGMKASDEDFFKRVPGGEFPGRDLSRREKTMRVYDLGKEMPLKFVLDDSDAAGLAPDATKKDLVALGLKSKKNAEGQDVEFITLQAGDDWALVHYVMWLSKIPLPRPGG
jgi:cytochrome c oxidase cbb3-type subunit 2